MTRHKPRDLNPHPHHALAKERAQHQSWSNRRVELLAFAVAAALFYWALDLLAR
jgi:hypothetical protein